MTSVSRPTNKLLTSSRKTTTSRASRTFQAAPRARVRGFQSPTAVARLRHLSTMTTPRFSPGSDPSVLKASLTSLLSSSGGRWTLSADGEGLERTVRFKTFAKTWFLRASCTAGPLTTAPDDFMTAVSLQCKLKNHHPEWSNVFNTTFIRWTTHSPKGLSAKDVDMAAMCDSLARDFGEIEDSSAPNCDLQGLANQATSTAGDCCVPKRQAN